jgi:2-polyprenyl-3-methyl-5-hydroxy-6-metoxy-1,4-benzoquinol methylase
MFITARKQLRFGLESIQSTSLRLALKEQGLWELYGQLERIVPDLRKQYTSFDVNSDYLSLNVRGLHSFQISLVNGAIGSVCDSEKDITIVDIGDSAGTHMQYLQQMHSDRVLKCMSVNVDSVAVQRILGKGLYAINARAEDLAAHGVHADIFISFEVLEHLPNPILFLRNLSYHTNCRALVITVPYVARSRVGLHHIRRNLHRPCNPENTHILELSPADWKLLFMHAGWAIREDRVYLQYPRFNILRLAKTIWRKVDFEGFWGAILVRDHTWSDLCSES